MDYVNNVVLYVYISIKHEVITWVIKQRTRNNVSIYTSNSITLWVYSH